MKDKTIAILMGALVIIGTSAISTAEDEGCSGVLSFPCEDGTRHNCPNGTGTCYYKCKGENTVVYCES